MVMLFRGALLALLLLAAPVAKATHMSGGEIYWECIGPSQYRFTMVIYRDCFGIEVDPSYTLQLVSPCGNRTLTVSTPGGREISQLCGIQLPNSTCNGGTLPGIQEYIYTGVITLPACDSWTISYTNIYRNAAIANLTNPGQQRTYIRATVNTAASPCNDSPRFTNTAIPYVCLGYPITYSFGAFDPEGDSLSYELIRAMGINGAALNYVAPHTGAVPIPGLTLNPLTGEVNFTLNTIGNWVVVVRVNHWVNGRLVGTVMRDMQFVAYPCDNVPPDPTTGLVENLSGSAVQVGPRDVELCGTGDFCFDMTISDINANNVLTAFSNIQQSLPGAVFSYTGTNPITATACWTATGAPDGVYSFIVNVNDGACPISAFQTYVYSVRVRAGITAVLNVIDETCPGAGNGTITAVPTSGQGPYTYQWSNGAPGSGFTAGAGQYSVVVTDASGCSTPLLTGTIGVSGTNAQAEAGPNITACMDGSPIPLNGTVTNAAYGTWSGGTGTFTGTWPNVSYRPSAGDVANGGVRLFLTTAGGGGCAPGMDSVLITLPNSFGGLGISGTNARCNGASDGTARVAPANPGLTYLWNDPAAQTTPVATGLRAGSFQVTVRDAFGCDTVLTVTIGQPTAVTVPNLSKTDETCAGAGNGSVTASATGGTPPYTYTWSNGATGPSITVGAGSYTVTVTDANGCAPVTATATVFAAGQPNAASAGPGLVACMGGLPVLLNGSVTNATGGAWSGGTGTFSGTWPNVSYHPSSGDVQNGSVRLVLTTTGNTICPAARDSVTITLPNSFAGMGISGTDARCNGGNDGSAMVSPANQGLTWTWNTVPVRTTPAVSGLGAGGYQATVRDAFGCDTTLNVTIGQPASLVVPGLTTTDESCGGFGNGTVTASASGGTAPYTFTWNNGATGPSITVGAGTYTVTVTDANGCAPVTATATVNAIGQPNLANAGPDIIGCLNAFPIALNGSVTNATGGAWSGGAGVFLGTWPNVGYQPAPGEVQAGRVQLVLTTTGNTTCPPASDTLAITLSNSFLNARTTTTDVACNGASDGTIAYTPALSGLSYRWNDPAGQTTPTATGLPPGTWSVTVTDALGCDTTLSATITEPAPLGIANVASTNVTCHGGANGNVTITIAGGTAPYTIVWSNGGNGLSQNGLGAGTHTATVTDGNGCTAQGQGIVQEPMPITLMAQAPDTVCVNTPVRLTAQAGGGAGGYVYTWPGIGTGDTLTVPFNSTGTVTVTVVDQAGCPGPSVTLAIAVLDLPNAVLTAYGDTTVCPGGTARVGARLTNYTGNATMVWPQLGAFGEGPFTVPVTANTDLTVTVTDVCANTLEGRVALRLETPPTFSLPPVIAVGCAPFTVRFPDPGLANGTRYAWDLGNGTSSNQASPSVTYPAGTWSVTLTVGSPLGCAAPGATTGRVVVHASPTAAFTASAWTADVNNARISFTDQSVGTIATRAWTFGDGGTSGARDPVHTYRDAGSFPVELWVRDTNGCTDSVTRVVTITPVYDVDIPNGFTPNPNGGGGGRWNPNDLDNDIFYPFARFVDEFRMRIFNRWGELVFESDDIRIGWDGYYRGQLSPQDVYVVQSWFKFKDGKEVQKLTDLTLFR